jgi:hypothetical protein
MMPVAITIAKIPGDSVATGDEGWEAADAFIGLRASGSRSQDRAVVAVT